MNKTLRDRQNQPWQIAFWVVVAFYLCVWMLFRNLHHLGVL